MTDDIFLLDFGLFVFDVVSDVLNGVNFIVDGDIIWGTVIISTIFLPMTVFLSYGASDIVFDKRISFSKRMVFLLLIPFLLPPAGLPLLSAPRLTSSMLLTSLAEG